MQLKALVVIVAVLGGVPFFAMLARLSPRARGWLVVALLTSIAIGDAANVNLMSMEAYRGPERGFEIDVADLIAFGLALDLVLRIPGRVRWLPYNSGWMAALFVVATMSTVTAAVPIYGGFALFKFVKVFVLYWAIVNCIRTGVPLAFFRWGLLAQALVVGGLAVYQKYGLGIYRVNGPFDHSNTIPLFVNLVLPALLYLGLADRRLSRPRAMLFVGGALAMTFAVVATFSRAGIALAGAGLVATLIIANRRAPSRRVRLASVGVGILMLAGGIAVADSLLDRIRNAPESSEAAREEFNHAARLMVADKPFGVGLNNFSYALTNVFRYRAHLVVMANEEQGGVAHHIYLLTAAEMGWLGLGLFLGIIIRFMFHPWWTTRRIRSLEASMALGCAGGMATLHLSGFLEWAFRITPVMYQYIVVAGMAVGYAEQARWRHRDARRAIVTPGGGSALVTKAPPPIRRPPSRPEPVPVAV